MFPRAIALIAIAASVAGVAAAAEPQVYRLSPEAIEAAKNQASIKAETGAVTPRITEFNGPSLYGSDAPRKKPDIHGEMGLFVGTGGARGIYGTAGMPVGDSGFAQFSFQNSQFDGRGYGHYGRPYGYSSFGLGYSSLGPAGN